MKRLIAAAALVLASLPLQARAQTVPYPPVPPESTLTLQGEGSVDRAPDQAKVFVQIITDSDSATTSTSKNNDVFNTFRSKMAGLVHADAIRTTSFNVEFIPYPPKGLPPEQRQPRYGYVTTRSLSITVSQIENVGKVVDAATAAGATNVGSISFELKDRKAAYLSALQAAMQDAKTQAATVAGAGGFTLARIRTVDVGYQSQIPRPVFAEAMSARAAAPTPTEIQPNGPITVTAHVTVSYTIR